MDATRGVDLGRKLLNCDAENVRILGSARSLCPSRTRDRIGHFLLNDQREVASRRGRRIMQVRDVLKTKGGKVYWLGVNATVADAIARMVQHNIGSLPIVDGDGRVVGIYTERDVLRGVHHESEDYCQHPMREVMTRNPVSCEPDDELHRVMGKMSDYRVSQLPVLQDAKLVGLVSIGDVVKFLYEQVETENRHLMAYIHGPV
jgi:predicted transcriptional regulator